VLLIVKIDHLTTPELIVNLPQKPELLSDKRSAAEMDPLAGQSGTCRLAY
jgi:hypothetical protein